MTRGTEKLIRAALRDGCREHCDALIDELRRLHAENQMLWKEREEPHKIIDMYVRECNRLESERDEARRTVREAHEAGTRLTAQRDALLEACKAYDKWADKTHCYDRELRPIRAQIRAAIKQAEENT